MGLSYFFFLSVPGFSRTRCPCVTPRSEGIADRRSQIAGDEPAERRDDLELTNSRPGGQARTQEEMSRVCLSRLCALASLRYYSPDSPEPEA